MKSVLFEHCIKTKLSVNPLFTLSVFIMACPSTPLADKVYVKKLIYARYHITYLVHFISLIHHLFRFCYDF